MITITKNKQYKGCPDGLFEETINETIVGNNDDRIFELEKQLHEQYAVNNNSNAGILISLISALLISFTGYGYVLYQYSIGECAIGIVNVAAIAVILVMVLLYCISVNLGAGQRMEQFITIAIRKKHYGKSNKYKDVFPDGYHPFNKNYCSFVQGVYNIWTKVALFAIIGVGACGFAINCSENAECCKFIALTIQVACSVIMCFLYRRYKFRKYQEREIEYLEQKQNNTISFFDFLPDLKREKDSVFLKQIKNWLIKKYKWILIVIAILLSFLIYLLFCSVKELSQESSTKIKLIKVQIID